MGHLLYGSSDPEFFEDRLLWHLKWVIVAKLRRRENFTFTWEQDPATAGGLVCIWIHPECDLRFEFGASAEPEINKAWLELLMHSANSMGGLHVVSEPAPEVASTPVHRDSSHHETH